MPARKREFSTCQKVMRSDNLRKHVKICQGRRLNSSHSEHGQDEKSFHDNGGQSLPQCLKFLTTPKKIKIFDPKMAMAPKKTSKKIRGLAANDNYDEESIDSDNDDNVCGDLTPMTMREVDNMITPSKLKVKEEDEIASSSENGDEDMDYEDEIKAEKEAMMEFEDKISKLVEYLTLHDVEEVGKILNNLEDNEISEEDTKLLRKLVKDWINHDGVGEEEPNIKDIEEVLKKIQSHGANRSELLRLTMALKDIKKNYYRVSDILRRMKLIFDDENANAENVADGIKGLIRDDLISEEQFNELIQMIHDLDIEQLIKVIRTTKSGRGIDFLPRNTKDLYQKVVEWCALHQKDPAFGLKQKILSALHELRFRKAIKKNDYDCAILELDY